MQILIETHLASHALQYVRLDPLVAHVVAVEPDCVAEGGQQKDEAALLGAVGLKKYSKLEYFNCGKLTFRCKRKTQFTFSNLHIDKNKCCIYI